MGACGIFRPPVQGGSNELISKFLSSMILYNHPSYFKIGEVNSCRLSLLPNSMWMDSDAISNYGKLNFLIIQKKSVIPSNLIIQVVSKKHDDLHQSYGITLVQMIHCLKLEKLYQRKLNGYW